MSIELNDMLVFEDETGNIYQDCVYEIINNKEEYKYKLNAAIYSMSKKFDFVSEFIRFEFTFDTHISSHVFREKKNLTNYKLKEIWHRTDEDTYKKAYIWSNEFKQMIPYVKGYISRKKDYTDFKNFCLDFFRKPLDEMFIDSDKTDDEKLRMIMKLVEEKFKVESMKTRIDEIKYIDLDKESLE